MQPVDVCCVRQGTVYVKYLWTQSIFWSNLSMRTSCFICFWFEQTCVFSLSVPRLQNISPPSAPFPLSLFLSLSRSLIAECEMTHGTRQSAGHTQLSGNEKWCWCQRWNRPNHPWAELHNSNIILLLPLLFYPLSLPCPLAHSPSLTLSSNRFDFYSSMFQWHRRSSERRVLGLECG